MSTVKQLLKAKPQQTPWCVEPDTSVQAAINMMIEKNIGSLLVCKEEKLVGIVSERDIVRKLLLSRQSIEETLVSEIMTRQVIYVLPEHSIDECMAIMTKKRIRHLPVLDADYLLGVISIGDVVKDVILEKESVIEQLEEYITTGY